jgi:iron complex outermembrane recepter protein
MTRPTLLQNLRQVYAAAGSRPFAVFLGVLSLAAFAPRVNAQTSSTDTSVEAKGPAIRLPAITVGATLRDEPLMSVPIPVAVISASDMQIQALRDISDIQEVLPSLTFRAGASNKDTSLLIRGVGTITTSPGVEPDVSTVVDGVVLARPGQATMDLLDIDHVELMRGPQGTLFGKNSSVGAINIVTRTPGTRSEGYIDASVFGGQGREQILHAGYSVVLIPGKLKASFSAISDDFSGNVFNIFLRQEVNGYQNEGFRTKWVYTPSSKVTGTFIVNYIHSYATSPNEGPFVRAYNISYPAGVQTNTSSTTLGVISPIVPSENNTQVNSGLLGRVYDDNGGVSGQFDFSLGQYTLTSITAYQHWFNNQFEDTGTVPQPTVGQTLSWDKGWLWFDQYSEELRLTSPTGHLLDYVGGLYFQEAIDTETYHRDIIQEPTAGTLVPNFGEAHYGTHGGNAAAYGEGTWNLTHSVRLVTGARLTRDVLEFYHNRITSSAVNVPGITAALAEHSGSTDAGGFSGRVGIQADIAKDTMAFATYSRGYKGPAYNVFFNQTALQVLPLSPETSDCYQVGVKSLMFDNRVQFTATAFDTIYYNYQANEPTTVLGTPVTNLINAGQVSSKGVEADLHALLTRDLSLTVSVTRDRAVIDQFNRLAAGATNYNGQPLPFAPKFKENTEMDYTVPVTRKEKLIFSTNYAWQTREQFQITSTPDTVQGAYGIWNAAVTLSKPSDGWKISLVGKNLNNTHYATLLTEAGGMVWRTVPRDNSRYWGVNLRKDF